MLSGQRYTINTKRVHYPNLNHTSNFEVKWCCWPPPHQISRTANGLRMTGEVIMTQGNRKSGWECIPSQSNLGVTLRLECGWLLAENTHQLKEWPWCGIMTLCEEAGGTKRTRCRQMLVRLPRRHSSDYLWSSSHGKRWPWREDIYASRGRDNGRFQ